MSERQVYGVVTYDALFKWILSEDSIRPSFFHAFIPDIVVQSSERLDDHMYPLQELQQLRHMIHNRRTTNLVSGLKEAQSDIKVHLADAYHENATIFLKSVLKHFDEVRYSFPKPRFDGTMDFVCKLDTGAYAIIEMQVLPQDNWDQRALAYAAALYGNQLRKGTSWLNIQKVIGLNILGGGLDNQAHWKETPEQYVRHYKLQEQINKEEPPRFLTGIDIIQYSLANVPKDVNSQEQKDWLCLLRNAHNMTEEDVRNEIKTPAVKEAFRRAKLADLPEEILENYSEEEAAHLNYSTLMADERAKGKAIGEVKAKWEIAQALRKQGMEIETIQTVTGLSKEEIISEKLDFL